MNENNLQYSFRESLKKYGEPLVIDILESELDANLNDGVIKEIPFISGSFYCPLWPTGGNPSFWLVKW